MIRSILNNHKCTASHYIIWDNPRLIEGSFRICVEGLKAYLEHHGL